MEHPLEHPAAAFLETLYRQRDREARAVLVAARRILRSNAKASGASSIADEDNDDDVQPTSSGFSAGPVYGRETTLDGHPLAGSADPDLDTALWALAIADSRAFRFNDAGTIFPLLDLFEHAEHANAGLEVRGDRICAVALADVPAGNMLTFSYYKADSQHRQTAPDALFAWLTYGMADGVGGDADATAIGVEGLTTRVLCFFFFFFFFCVLDL
jgi:hypothetical protein